MGGRWQTARFDQLIDFREGPGILARDFRETGVPLLRLKGLNRGGSILQGCNHLDPDMVKRRWSHFAVRPGDVLLSTSACLGRTAVVDAAATGAIPYTGLMRMRPKSPDVHPTFIPYLLEAPDFQQQIEAMGVGSVIRHFGPSHLQQIRVLLPPLSEQRRIACALGELDQKIELNQRMIETLGEIARTLFTSWFVDFDPVRSKAGGGQPHDVDTPTAALFPSLLEDSPLGPIPAGWRVATLDEACSELIDHRGKTPRKMGGAWAQDGVPALSARHIKGGAIVRRDALRYVDEDLYRRWMPVELRQGDVVMTSEAPVGELLYLQDSTRYCMSQRVIALRASPRLAMGSYLYLWLGTPAARADIERRATGTTVVGIRQTELRRVKILLPPLPLQATADAFFTKHLALMAQKQAESETLTSIRNTLLPQLLTGAVRIEMKEMNPG